MSILESGIGNLPELANCIQSHFAALDISAILVESLAEDDCELKERKAIVPSIASIVMTTISSTKVKALYFVSSIGMYNNRK